MPLRVYKDLVRPRYSTVPEQLARTLYFPWTQLALLPSHMLLAPSETKKLMEVDLIFEERESGYE